VNPTYTVTNTTITIIWEGSAHTVKKGSPNFEPLRDAILAKRWADVPNHLTVAKAIESWSEGHFKISGSLVTYKGTQVSGDLHARMLKMVTAGDDPGALCRFYERLQANPSFRSVQQLYPFLQHRGIPITEDGCFLAYKGVRANFKDVHSGQVDNSPGTSHEMTRNLISDDPRTPCHFGFHVGALKYASGFGPRVVICKVDPADVVCVPYDSSQEKMRVCAYSVIGLYGGEMPSTTIGNEDIPEVEVKTKTVTRSKEEGAVAVKLPKAKAPKKTKAKADPSMWAGYDGLDSFGLLKKPLDNLRKYATYALKVVGASKIRGGKVALVDTILKARD
jgi:hypothetical protein